jgi:tripartite-type tricarboxylate transporter receptor subunit TctC
VVRTLSSALLGQKFTEAWGKPIVIENVTGAAGNIAAERVAKATADGYTLGFMTEAQMAINPHLYKLTYDPVKDFAPVSHVVRSQFLLVVHNGVPVKNVQELVNLIKARPGESTFASGGSGSIHHMAAELFKSAAHVDIRHIPYKGVVPAIPDLLGGRVTMMFISPVALATRARREATRARRDLVGTLFPVPRNCRPSPSPAIPASKLRDGRDWLRRQGHQRRYVRKLYLETVKATALPDLRTKFAELGVEGVGNSPDEFAALIKSENSKWAKVIKESGIKP